MYKVFILFILISASAVAQDNLPRDENGKIVFEEIVKVDSMPASSLLSNAKTWIRKIYSQTEKSIRYDSNSVSAKGLFLVYTKGGISKEIHGAIRYNVRIMVKNNKYQYRFSDFVFEYYKINRNYQYVPTGQEKPLEAEKFTGWEPAWKNHKKETLNRITNLISSLKSEMPRKAKIEQKKENTVKKEEW
jgi:hypothetical protein